MELESHLCFGLLLGSRSGGSRLGLTSPLLLFSLVLAGLKGQFEFKVVVFVPLPTALLSTRRSGLLTSSDA